MVTLRELRQEDIGGIVQAFAGIGWNKPAKQFEQYLAEQGDGVRTVIVAFDGGDAAAFAGYLTIVWQSSRSVFRDRQIPEIVDLNVLPVFQRRGIATMLMDAAEARIAVRTDDAGIAVGIVADYGAAQRLYVKRGYVPDGSGLHTSDGPVALGDRVIVDDGLVICLTKRV